MSTQDEEIARFTADAQARYQGRCAPDLYPVTVKNIPSGTWVETDQPERPPDDSFNFVQEHEVEIQWEWEEDGETHRDTATKYNGPDYGVPFIDSAPGDIRDSLIDYRCRARARWGMQDAHPENRGFMALPGYNGKTYYGHWSYWSEWYTFENAERVRREREELEAQKRRAREHEERYQKRKAEDAERRRQSEARNKAALAAQEAEKERARKARERMGQETEEGRKLREKLDAEARDHRVHELREGLRLLSDEEKLEQLRKAATDPVYAERYAEPARIVAEEWGLSL